MENFGKIGKRCLPTIRTLRGFSFGKMGLVFIYYRRDFILEFSGFLVKAQWNLCAAAGAITANRLTIKKELSGPIA